MPVRRDKPVWHFGLWPDPDSEILSRTDTTVGDQSVCADNDKINALDVELG